ncbi:MAG: hypothetical protein ACI97A_004019, partial [Planctomycetota bacterium]
VDKAQVIGAFHISQEEDPNITVFLIDRRQEALEMSKKTQRLTQPVGA